MELRIGFEGAAGRADAGDDEGVAGSEACAMDVPRARAPTLMPVHWPKK